MHDSGDRLRHRRRRGIACRRDASWRPEPKEVALEVRKLGRLAGGQVGLFVGNGSGKDFANLVVTPTK